MCTVYNNFNASRRVPWAVTVTASLKLRIKTLNGSIAVSGFRVMWAPCSFIRTHWPPC